MKLGDSFSGKGNVLIKIFDKNTNTLIDTKENHNLIVKIGRSTLIKLLAGESNAFITKMMIGSGGTADTTTNAFNPIPPVDGDTELTNLVHTVDVSSKDIDLSKTNPMVTFTALFDCADVNSLVNECGLLFNDGTTMFARHTFDTTSLKVSSNFVLQISWTIEF